MPLSYEIAHMAGESELVHSCYAVFKIAEENMGERNK